jgi:hypothetical protein
MGGETGGVVRENGNPNQLVTVGQDEGGTRDRPNPWFHSHVVDFTCNHSWWQNDDILWDSVITKTPYKPNLIGETGVMFVEGVDGRAWRTEEECRNLLERKMALAFAAGCAGFIQWCWNTNVYMDSDNEVAIGFLRADGTEKPELDAFRGIARFFAANAQRMVGRKPEEAVVVIPHCNMFSVRNLADKATRTAVRTLEYGLGIPCRAVSEFTAEDVGDAKLIVLPSARVITERCWKTLMGKVEAGAALLVNGYIEADEYWRNTPRLSKDGDGVALVPIGREEYVTTSYMDKNGVRHYSTHLTSHFGHDAIQKLDKSARSGLEQTHLRRTEHGKGMIFQCSVPIELESGSGAAYAVYEEAAQRAFSRRKFFLEHFVIGCLRHDVVFDGATLFLFANESAHDAPRPKPWPDDMFLKKKQLLGITVPFGRIALVFQETETRDVIAKYEPT